MGKAIGQRHGVLTARLCFVVCAAALVSCGPSEQSESLTPKSMNTYDWLASNSAPAGSPMKIIAGTFALADSGSLYIPPKILHSGWGKEVSIHLVGDETKPLPDSIEITFFSYLEDKLYRGAFSLPYDRITDLFAKGYRSFEEDSGRGSFDTIIAGVAPGGAVAVWVSGAERQVEVFFGQAQELDSNWHQTMGVPTSVDRRQFIAGSIAEAAKSDPLVQPTKARIPFGIWAEYRTQYQWKPIFEGMTTPTRLERVHFFNGERDYMVLPLDATAEQGSRPVPSLIAFTDVAAKRSYRLTFDEQEVLSAFAKLGASGRDVELVFATSAREGQSQFDVIVRSGTEIVVLKKLKAEFFRAD